MVSKHDKFSIEYYTIGILNIRFTIYDKTFFHKRILMQCYMSMNFDIWTQKVFFNILYAVKFAKCNFWCQI